MSDQWTITYHPPRLRYSGQLGAGTRRVTITGTATYTPESFSTLGGIREYLMNSLQSQGWRVINFDIGNAPWFFSGSVGINITADVPADYSNQQHLDQVYQLFNSFYVTYGLFSHYPFTNVSLSATGAELPNYVPPTTTTVQGTPTPTPRTPTGNGSNSNVPTAAEIAALMNPGLNTATQLFGGVGVGTMAIAGLLILVVLARK